jgi:hypothetical protein
MKALLLMLPAAAFVIAVGCSSNNDDLTGCAGLVACCATLSGAEAETCDEGVTASGGSDSLCQSALTDIENTGLCPSASNSGATGCSALSNCCNSLPVAENPTECMEVANNGTDEACTESLSAYASGGYCGGSAPGQTFGPKVPLGDADVGGFIGPDGACENGSTEEDGSCCLVVPNGTACESR